MRLDTSSNEIRTQIINAEANSQLIAQLASLETAPSRHELGALLCEMHNANEISLTSQANLDAIIALDAHDFWTIVHPINEAIEDLKCTHSAILQLVITLVDKAGNDALANRPYSELVKWSKNNPEGAKGILEGALAFIHDCLQCCQYALQGLDDLELMFEFADSSKTELSIAGIQSLGCVQKVHGEIVQRIIDKCIDARGGTEDKDLRAASIRTAFQVWEKAEETLFYRQNEFLSSIFECGSDDELLQISAMLFYYDDAISDDNIDLIMEGLSRKSEHSDAILHWLDNSLNPKTKRWQFKKVAAVFAVHISNSQVDIEPKKLSGFCRWAWSNSENTSWLFSDWLLNGSLAQRSFLAGMIGSIRGKQPRISISNEDLPADPSDCVFLARKCVGFFWLYPISAVSLLLSIYKNSEDGVRDDIEQLIYDPLLLCYSGSLRDYLEEQNSASTKDCITRLLDMQDAYLNGLKQAKDLVELRPTNYQRRSAAMKDHQRNKDIQKQANRYSIFADLISHSTLLYGKKSFTTMYGPSGEKNHQILPLSEFSHSVEIPRMMTIDSVGFDQMLKIFRVERKKSK